MTFSDSKGRETVRRAAFVAAVCLGLTACGSVPGTTDESEPVGIGRGTDAFKRSPCACIDVPQRGDGGDYLERLRRRLGTPLTGAPHAADISITGIMGA